MAEARSNIALIGMPGAGKSTIGVLLAKRLGKGFVDTDLVIQTAEGRTLQQIVDSEGHLALRPIEEREIVALRVRDHVIATGGSAAYSDRAMAALRTHAVIVYLDTPLRDIEARVRNLNDRGLSMAAGQTLGDLYAERTPLYERHADLRVDCAGLDQEAVVEAVVRALQG
jgi:shikimate kinase